MFSLFLSACFDEQKRKWKRWTKREANARVWNAAKKSLVNFSWSYEACLDHAEISTRDHGIFENLVNCGPAQILILSSESPTLGKSGCQS